MNPFRSAVLACLISAAAAGEAAVPATPVATVDGWVKAIQANDLAAAWDRLPEAQRKTWSTSIAAPAPAEGGDRRPGRGGGRMLDMPLRMLSEGEQAQNGGKLLAATLAALATSFAAEGQPAPASAALPADQPFLAIIPRMTATGMIGGLVNGILGSGLETHQIAAVDTWGTAYAAWAKDAPFADEARATAAQPHLQAFAVEVRKAQAGADARAVLAAWGAGLPRLKQALAVYGLDVDAALASAKVEATPADSSGAVVVVVHFLAFGKQHTLPLKMRQADGGWEIAADSPALRWLRSGAQGMMGRIPGMGVGRPGGGRGLTPADPPADVPKQGPVGF